MGSVRTAARRRVGIEREVVDPASVDMHLHDWRRMEVSVAWRRTCDQEVMMCCQRGLRRARRDVCSAGRDVVVCLFVSMGVGDVGGFVADGGDYERRVLSWWVKWARLVEAMGLVKERGGIWWDMVPASRWARTRQRSAGGEMVPVMMDSEGQWVYVVKMVRVCVLAMRPL
jgi:hypothetical protein